ncbi:MULTISPECIES: CHAT domain-containing protein [Glycomyces]|uniref:CHAT domain-containing protein n=2 Tax=Glycomyces TaxID=58113 RepID=A0A9X3SVE0_9ACTN|nr:CHAT domain-containing protein [Glycomyces lechevalierae]MDA1384677.1 CHAT domain-containing protein [Glycomyces lechevalierae]MDR7337870.1 tetratricopeptide (TPR) repeat protein [Glycomyces lechevalierae]
MSASERFQRFLLKTASALDPEFGAMVKGNQLLLRVMHTKDYAAMDEAIDCLRRALAGTSITGDDRSTTLTSLATALMMRFERTRDNADRDGAIDAERQSLAMRPPGHPKRHSSLANLAGMLTQRYMFGGDPADIDAAIECGSEAVELVPEGDENRATAFANLGSAYRYRFERQGDPSDIRAAVEAAETAVEYSVAGDPRAVTRRSDLSSVLVAKVRAVGGTRDLDRAVDHAAAAVLGTSSESPYLATVLTNYGVALRARFDFVGESSDLDTAIKVSAAAVEATPERHVKRPDRLTSLALALRARFEYHGGDADLDAAIDALRAATLGTEHSRATATRLQNLGSVLRTRFARTGDRSDLDAAVGFLQQALDALGPDDPARTRVLSNLGITLLTRSARFGAPEDLDAAVDLGRRSIEATPDGDPYLAMRLLNTASSLISRYERADAPSDIDEAIDLARRAVTATPDGHPRLAAAWNLLSASLQYRYKTRFDPDDLREAVAASSHAVAKSAPDEFNRAPRLASLAAALMLRYELEQRIELVDAAIAALQEGLAVKGAATTDRIDITKNLAHTTIARAEASGAAPKRAPAFGLPHYEKAIEQLATLSRRGLAHEDHQHRLEAHAAALGRDATAAAIASGDLEKAVRLSEQGRSVWWSGVLDLRADLTELRTAHPALAAELERCRAILDRPSMSAFTIEFESTAEAPDRAATLDAGERYDELVGRIRALEPTEAFPHPVRFLLGPSPADASDVDLGGPVILVNVSGWRCDALAITGGTIEHVELSITLREAEEKTLRYLEALGRYSNGDPDGRFLLEMATRPVLEWMWKGIAEPVLKRLGLLGEPGAEPPRVWWCPTGPLSLLPLHAAATRKGDGGAVMDQVVSSYTPTLRALAEARSKPVDQSPSRMLVATIARTPIGSASSEQATSRADLAGAAAERSLLAELFDEDRLTLLGDERATREAMLTELGRHRWAHFACHGVQNLAEPGRGGLVPFDWEHSGLITVADLSSTSAGAGEFAFLSACQTATGGVTGFDEAVNLSAALHYSGWRHVIGTLWTVYDDSASQVADDLYRTLVKDDAIDSAETARALHDAMLRIRKEHPNDTAAWARFIHSGP